MYLKYLSVIISVLISFNSFSNVLNNKIPDRYPDILNKHTFSKKKSRYNSAFKLKADSTAYPRLVLDLQLFDLPYQFDASKTTGNFFKAYTNPGMSQSLSLSSSIYSAAHYGIDKAFKSNKLYNKALWRVLHLTAIGVSDLVLTFAPGAEGWLHEEYHRAVMTRHRVNSFNDMNKFPLGAELVSVNSVKDIDLQRFKRENSKDFIRMHVAGIEGENKLVEQLQKNNFFYRTEHTHEILYMLITVNSAGYVGSSSIAEIADVETNKLSKIEKNEKDRDFTGFDFTGWTYDLFRPGEAYELRGPHPYYSGIDRYILTTDLTTNEKRYLKKMGSRQFLNFLSPMMYYVRSIKLKNGIRFNFAVRHLLTSSGDDRAIQFFFQSPSRNLVFTFHNYQNYQTWSPALELELFEHKVMAGNYNLLVSPRIIAGLQAKDQSFTSSSREFFGYAGCKFTCLSSCTLSPNIELAGKTDGWLAGNEFTGKNLSVRMGLTARF